MSVAFSVYAGPAVLLQNVTWDWWSHLPESLTNAFACPQGEDWQEGDTFYLIPNRPWPYSRPMFARDADNEPLQVDYGQPRAEVNSFVEAFAEELDSLVACLPPGETYEVHWCVLACWG